MARPEVKGPRMINGVGSPGPTRIGQAAPDKVGAKPATEAVAAPATEPAATPSLVAALAAAGPPVNQEKIKAIQLAIASGQYPIDAKAIAQKMIALDLPRPADA